MKPTIRELAEPANRPRIAAASALAVGSSATALVVPWLVGASVEQLSEGSDFHAALALIVALLGARLVLEFGATLVAGNERYRYIATLRGTWYRRMLGVPPGYETDERRQDWISILSYDIPRIAEVVVDLPIALTQAMLTLVGALLVMAQIHAPLTLLVFAAAPIAYVMARLALRAMRERALKYWDLEVEAMTRAESGLTARWAVLAFSQQDRFDRDFSVRASRAAEAGVSHLRLLAFVGPAVQFVTFMGMALIVLVAASEIGAELSTAGTLSFVLYGLLLSAPLRAMADGWTAFHEVDATLARLGELDDAPTQAPEGSETLERFETSIELRNVCFGWRSDPLLRSVSFEIRPEETIALVGDNGAGKSTLISLLLGFAQPESGAILIDGVALEALTRESRRALFAVVPQHAALVAGTILENVRFGRPDASVDEVETALELALAGFVSELPEGLHTRVGEGGLELSGGQRQRIAIARAILTRAPVLVLDEATSGYDAESSALFLRRTPRLPHQSVVWITHEPEIWRASDRIIRLADGVATEDDAFA